MHVFSTSLRSVNICLVLKVVKRSSGNSSLALCIVICNPYRSLQHEMQGYQGLSVRAFWYIAISNLKERLDKVLLCLCL